MAASSSTTVWDVAVWGPEHAIDAAVRSAKHELPALRIKVRKGDDR